MNETKTDSIISVREIHSHMEDSFRLAKALAAGAAGSDTQRGATLAFAKMVAGSEMGIAPAAAQRAFHDVKGKLGMSADAMVGIARKAGWKFKIEHSDPPGESCKVTASREDEEYAFAFTREMAKQAGLGGDNWKKYPWDMLYARAASHVCRKVAPEILFGIYEPSEIGFESPTMPAEPVAKKAGGEKTEVIELRPKKKVENTAEEEPAKEEVVDEAA